MCYGRRMNRYGGLTVVNRSRKRNVPTAAWGGFTECSKGTPRACRRLDISVDSCAYDYWGFDGVRLSLDNVVNFTVCGVLDAY
jgi:hypothetical protein